MFVLPFEVSIYEGLGSVHGLLRMDPGALIVEYQVKDAVFGILQSEWKEIRLPLDLIATVTLREGWFKTTLEIQTGSMRVWGDFPTNRQGRVCLSLAKSQRDAARILLAQLDPKSCPLDADFA